MNNVTSQRPIAMTPAKFARISETLTGVTPLDRALAAEYLARVRKTDQAQSLTRLALEYDAIITAGGDVARAITDRILGHDDLRALSLVIIMLWYFGEIHEPGRPAVGGHPEHYFRGLFWEVVQAHPQGLSGGYFGHWAYPPDN
jgi:hypothetical protein